MFEKHVLRIDQTDPRIKIFVTKSTKNHNKIKLDFSKVARHGKADTAGTIQIKIKEKKNQQQSNGL
ncbi:hypothetical protein BpHYR1_044412 [Brachionus plicatilis]|uniref:Uncharacterized protein n=1 Tax=Brachionus plicatilis TaxID=10195 RepID=A0A3M7RGR6_BRAPC|nr:hypothetical protein BpHYR1_044412 [Brachionus plicatilis]